MRGVNVTKKTGFNNDNLKEPIVLNDMRGIEFYNSELSNVQPVRKFNLPVGQYIIKSGQFSEREFPVYFQKNILPPRERFFRPYPSGFKLVFRPTKHKAFIDWSKKEIVIDSEFRNRSLPILYYIRFHEFAHRVYKTEKYTDALAENMMINHGFNPSQIHRSLLNTLSDRQQERKLETVKRALKK